MDAQVRLLETVWVCFVTYMVDGFDVAMHITLALLKLDDCASNMAITCQLVVLTDALIKALPVDFEKDTEPAIVAMSSIVQGAYSLTSKSSTVMDINIVRQQVMEFFGMENWEQVHTFAAVCKLWRMSCLPHLSNIGKVLVDGGADRRFNVSALLCYLQLEKFRNVQWIFIP